MTAWDYNILEFYCRDAFAGLRCAPKTPPRGYAAAFDVFAHQLPAAKRFYSHNVHFASCFESS